MKEPMRRTQLNLTQRQHKLLLDEAKATGISLSELIRRVLDEYLKKRGR